MNRVMRVVLPLLVLAGGVGGAAALIATRKEPEKKVRPTLPPEVDVVVAKAESAPAAVEGLGTVVAARSLILQAEVSGRVVYVHPDLEPGGTIGKGEVLIRLDARQYELALEERRAQAETARFNLAVEEGRVRVAQREWKVVGAEKGSDQAGRSLALREPHLKNAQASLQAAEAQVARAELDLSRAVLRAPFDVVVQSEATEVGQIVTPQSQLAQLVGTEAFWLQVPVPVGALRWVHAAPEGGSPVKVVQALGEAGVVTRTGRVLRVMSELDPKGRMARLLVAVDDPLSLKSKGQVPLFLSALARVTVEGRSVEGVFVLPRGALRQGEQVWVVDAQGKLHIRTAVVAWQGEEEVYLREGVGEGDRVVVSRLSAPVEGMAVRVRGEGNGK